MADTGLTTLPNTLPTGMSAADFIRGISQIISGAGNFATARGDMTAAQNAANVADPFASQRGGYQDQLRAFMTNPNNNPMNATTGAQGAVGRLENLMQDPNQITTMPGYQFGLNQSLEAVNRGAGASGMLGSGNRLAALQDRGEGYASNWYDKTFQQMMGDVNANLGVGNLFLQGQGQGANQLLTASGATTGSPGAAAQALMQGRANQAGSIGAGIGGVASGITNLLPGIQRMLTSGGDSGFTVPGGVSGMGTGGDWGTDIFGTGGDSGILPGGANGDWDFSGIDLSSIFGGP